LEKDVQLGLFPKQDKDMKILARTKQDDIRDAEIKLEDILPKEPTSAISYDNLMILLETLETEIEKLEGSASYGTIHCSGVIQGVKAICALLGSLDTIEIYDAVNRLKEFCNNGPGSTYNIKVSSLGNLPELPINQSSNFSQVPHKCTQKQPLISLMMAVIIQKCL
jgi:phosphatidylinositol-4-phosphate 3-kinase